MDTEYKNQNVVPQQTSGISNLPNEILVQVLDSVNDNNTLLSCRQVCCPWRGIIDGTDKLFKRVTLQMDQRTFTFDPTNIPACIKSICFYMEPQFSLEVLPNTIEAVKFTLKIGLTSLEDSWKQVYSTMLCKFHVLSEVHVYCDFTKFLHEMSLEDRKQASCKIRSLTLNIRHSHKVQENIQHWNEFILKLANLNSLSFVGNDGGTYFKKNIETLLPIITSHFQKFPGILQIFRVDGRYSQLIQPIVTGHDWIQLYLTAGKLGTTIDAGPCSMNDFLRFEPDEELQLNVKNCWTITIAKLVIPDEPNDFTILDRMKYCTQLSTLYLDMQSFNVKQALQSGQVANAGKSQTEFLRRLDRLTTFKVMRSLHISGIILVDVLDFFTSISKTFPLLTDLELEKVEIVHGNLFDTLRKVNSLYSLTIVNSLLTDGDFITPMSIDNEDEDFEDTKNADSLASSPSCTTPAIVMLKSLKQLHISYCVHLTDRCLTESICFLTTLEKLHVEKCEGFTEKGFQALNKEAKMKCAFVNEVENERIFFKP